MADSTQEPDRFNLRRLRQACSECSVHELCLPLGLDRPDMERLEGLVERVGPLHENDHLYRMADPFQHIYAVRSGTVKTYVNDEQGREHVLGFHIPGELVGLDAIYPEKHQCSAMAVDTVFACRLSYSDLTSLAGKLPGLQKQLFRLMSKDIGVKDAQQSELGAEERVGAFLLDWSSRLKKRGYAANHFLLSMPRRDLANYLGLAPETVSRVFRRFQDDGLIAVNRRELHLLNPAGLRSRPEGPGRYA